MPFTENRVGELLYMTASNIGTVHAFTTRFGGVSGGVYSSMNLGYKEGDDPENVRRNYAILGAALRVDPDGLVFSHQVHKDEVRVAGSADRRAPYAPIPYEADGLITAEEDLPLIIFSADCTPILLHDPVRGAVGAVHAGWRGTVRDIVGTAVGQMARELGCRPADIRAAIGPCISACCFETGKDVRDAVERVLGDQTSRFAAPRGDKYMVDLKGVNAVLLERAGLERENIDVSPECTSCQSDKYWSHRVTKGKRGSQAAVIILKGKPY